MTLDSEEQTTSRTAQSLWYCVANIGCGLFFSLNSYMLPLFMQRFTSNASILGLVGGSHSFEGAVIQPFIGMASDKLPSKFGRRRPFILAGMGLSALFLSLTPVAAHLPGSLRLVGLLLCIFLFTMFFNVGFDPYQSLMTDITPEKERGKVTGLWALIGTLAQAALLYLGFRLVVMFHFTAIVMILTTLITCIAVKERRHASVSSASNSPLKEMRRTLKGLGQLAQARRGMVVFAISGAGIGAILPFITLYVKTQTKCSDVTAGKMVLFMMLATIIFVMPFGWVTDKLGAKRVVVTAYLLIGIASIMAIGAHTLPQIAMALTLAGIGNAAQSAAVYPLLVQLVPNEEVGFYTGFQTTMLSIAQPVTTFLTGQLINKYHNAYQLVFGICAVCLICALVLLMPINTMKAKDEIRLRQITLQGHPA